ncbi:MAG: hypothetical protein JO356_01120 [Acidobacteria bacterium]|nr:hypothetical protein [Acidobacteriota bacterium]
MNLYRVSYFHVTGRTRELVRGQEFVHRHGAEKVAFVVADTPEAASAFISTPNDEITGVTVEKKDVQVASGVNLETPRLEVSAQVASTPVLLKRPPRLADFDEEK